MLTALIAFALQSPEIELKPYAKLDAPMIDEMSGIAKSHRFKDTYWVHNDSGDVARIFPIHADGTLIHPAGLSDPEGLLIDGAKNHDWEDIALVGDTLYISDMGNNGNKRKTLGIYQVQEPDPTQTVHAPFQAWFGVRYPDQTAFPPTGLRPYDCEALFLLHGTMFTISKERLGKSIPATTATLYRLDDPKNGQVTTLTKIESKEMGGWVTAADVSPRGNTVAVLTQFPQQSVWLFDAKAPANHLFSLGHGRQIKLRGGLQCEALCFDSETSLIIGNEQGYLYRLSIPKANH